jgi:hypothetical protein
MGLLYMRLLNCFFSFSSVNQIDLAKFTVLTPLDRLRVFENRVLWRIFGPESDEVTWEWRKLHNEELTDLYCSPTIFRVIKLRVRLAGHVELWG